MAIKNYYMAVFMFQPLFNQVYISSLLYYIRGSGIPSRHISLYVIKNNYR